MKHPRDLDEADLKQIAERVREKLEAKHGKAAVAKRFKGTLGADLLKETFLAVINKLEEVMH